MSDGTTRPLKVGLLGVGTVGSAFARMVERHPNLTLGRALVRDLDAPRAISHPELHLTTDVDEVVDDCDVLVEVMGGTTLAVEAATKVLASGRHVVTANKAALAERWDDYLPYLHEGRVHFEAAVLAGVPVIGAVAGALRGSMPARIDAVLNGTCSFILSRLEQGASYDDALAEAQHLGYAEADPTLDVGGFDAAHKLTILARLAVDPNLTWSSVRQATRGIEDLTPERVHEAMEDGGRVQLVGSIEPDGARWAAKVRPVYLPEGHPLGSGSDAQAGMVYVGVGGTVTFAGPGAGGDATASAVLGDVLDVLSLRRGPMPLVEAVPVPAGGQRSELGELPRAPR